MILEGEVDYLPEQAFLNVGTIEEAIEKGKKLLEQAAKNKKDSMMKELHLSIVSPEKSIFDGNVKIVTLPGMIGSFSILPGHAPIVSSLKAGTLSYTTMDGEEHTMDIQGGFVEMSDGTVSACVSPTETPHRHKD